MWVWLRLKLIADVGLVGLPNAGKSTLLSVVSAAKPKIADYPFTTLHPNLGVVGIDNHEFVMADIPGLIEGARHGAGIGHRFLGHVERCRVLLHLVDVTASDPIKDWKIVSSELEAYAKVLADKREVIVLTKADAAPEDYIEELKHAFIAVGAGSDIHFVSSVTGLHVKSVLRNIYTAIEDKKTEEERANNPETNSAAEWSPLAT